MATPDYPRARWYGAYYENYSRSNRPGSIRINKVVVHHVNGSWSSAINWFNSNQPGSGPGVSAHYTVRSSDGFIGQSVQEKDIAHHAGNWPVNQTAIGIEHEGYGNNPQRWFTPALYNSSARLTAYLCKKYNIPIKLASGPSDAGILAHRQTTSTYCPGEFDFNRYIQLVRDFAGGGSSSEPAPSGQIIDNSTSGRFKASGNWDLNTWNKKRYGSNYRAAKPNKKVIDPARFKVRIPRRGRYRIFARWPSHADYNPRATFRIRTANGIKAKAVNQRLNGDKWVSLGVHEMPAGDRWSVELSRRSQRPGTIVADAIRVVKI